jgi:hypothetical protein
MGLDWWGFWEPKEGDQRRTKNRQSHCDRSNAANFCPALLMRRYRCFSLAFSTVFSASFFSSGRGAGNFPAASISG